MPDHNRVELVIAVTDGYSGNIKMKRARAGQVKSKGTLTLYNKLSELVGTLGELISIQELTDTLILQVSCRKQLFKNKTLNTIAKKCLNRRLQLYSIGRCPANH